MQYGQISDRVGDALRRRFNVGADFQLSLTPEVTAVIPFEAPELLYHAGWRRWQRSVFVAAVAGQVARCQFRVKDPPNQNVTVLERIIVACGAVTDFAGDWGYGPAAVDLGTLTTTFEPRDQRQTPSAGDSVVISSDTNAVALTATAVQLPTLANTPLEIPGGPWICFPGFNLLLTTTVANSAAYFNFIWRTRPFNDTEISP